MKPGDGARFRCCSPYSIGLLSVPPTWKNSGQILRRGRVTSVCNIQHEEADRMVYDDADDYDGLNENHPNPDRRAINQYSGIRVRVSVTCAGTRWD